MSGTSMDGVDAVLCEFHDGHFGRVRSQAQRPYPPKLRRALLRLQREAPALTLDALARLDRAVADSFVQAAQAVLRRERLPIGRVTVIGSHGQTVFHDPRGARSSLQLGDPSTIAAATGITTVADFRRADIARGGEGAPLVPAFHHAVFAGPRPRAIVNIGGIANVTVLRGLNPARVTGFDTGPGNGLMDEWIEACRGRAYDRGGRWAASGQVDRGLLEALLGDPWFAQAAPKSTGRDRFHLDWVRQRYARLARLPAKDVQRTLLELTAVTVADAIRRENARVADVFVCGGGALNGLLMQRLAALLAPAQIHATAKIGLDPLHVEGAAFAWLAMRTLQGEPGSLPAVTGARSAAVLGGIYRAGRYPSLRSG